MQLSSVRNAINARASIEIEALELVPSFRNFYPKIDEWVASQVIPGLLDGSRHIVTSKGADGLQALAILKKDAVERKICTLWVHPHHRKKGLGQWLIDQSISWLECRQPLLSVPEEEFAAFHQLLLRNGFKLNHRLVGYYRTNACEFVFNGTLSPRLNLAMVQ